MHEWGECGFSVTKIISIDDRLLNTVYVSVRIWPSGHLYLVCYRHPILMWKFSQLKDPTKELYLIFLELKASMYARYRRSLRGLGNSKLPNYQ